MNSLKEVSARETEVLLDDQNAATSETCSKVIKGSGKNECTSSRKKRIQKETLDSTTVLEERRTRKRGKDLRTAKRPVCSKTSDKPNVQKHTQVKDKGNGRKRKRAGDSSPAEEHKSGKSMNKSSRFKSPLPSAKETHNDLLPGPDSNIKKGNRHPKHLMSQSVKEDNTHVTTEEIHSLRKSNYNQLPLPDFSFTETDVLSSELSMEFSSPESNTNPLFHNDDTEEDVQLPVIKLKEEPERFECWAFVWCKFQRYPYWPSLIKSIKTKEKRASIIFVEECLSDPNSRTRSFQVSLHILKHYDCPEKQDLLDIARKDYGKSVDWCDSLICDYRIRLGCGSFSGSFLEYCTSAISYPVRKEYSEAKFNFPSLYSEIHCPIPDIADSNSHEKKKILPDRARASRDRANEKLVEFIVKTKQAENHLISILTGKKKSSWLENFQVSNQTLKCLETYIEDEKQVELVVDYLLKLCESMSKQSKKLMNGAQTTFILEVMLPEAVIFAISNTEGLSYEKAEKKFLQGPLLSKRERKQFESQILDKKKIKTEENL